MIADCSVGMQMLLENHKLLVSAQMPQSYLPKLTSLEPVKIFWIENCCAK
jgi:hypothetical protein